MVVGERNPQTTIDTLNVMQRVDKPTLNIRTSTKILTIRARTEVRVRLGRQRRVVQLVLSNIAIDRVNPMTNRLGPENTVFVIPAISGTIRRNKVPFWQVDMLADNISRRCDLIVINVIVFRHQIGLVIVCTLIRVQTHHKRLWWSRLVQSWFHIIPER